MGTNRLFYILVGGISILVLVTVVLILRGVGTGSSQKRTILQFWGVFDERRTFEKITADYRNATPGVSVNYKQIPYEDYERTLLDALAAGTGPDIVMIHNSWLPKHKDKLKPAPEKITGEKEPFFTVKDYQSQFVDVANKDLTVGKSIYGFPLYVDTLALFYNKDMFNTAGITRPPENWDEVNQYVELLTKYDSRGNILKSGAVLGTARNINRSGDILMALMLQSGVKMTNDFNSLATFAKPVNNEPVGQRSLEYYTSFANPKSRTYSWNDNQSYSIDAFVEGDAAMMINYSNKISVLKEKAARLNFGVAPMPQPPGSDDTRNFANYWAVAVINSSKHSDAAWKFLRYLGSKAGSIDYLNASLRPAARRDIIALQKDDLELGLFATQALTAKSWYQIDNRTIDGIFADMIDDVNFKRLSVKDALKNAENRINVLMAPKI